MPAPAGRRAVGSLLALGAARGELAAQLLARALRHVLPVVGRVVPGRLAGAGMAGGAAVVLPRLRDAVALLALRVGTGRLALRAGRAGKREDPRDGRVDERVARGHGRLLGDIPRANFSAAPRARDKIP